MPRERRESLLVNRRQPLSLLAERFIYSARGSGDLFQRCFVEPRLHELAGVILHEVRAAVRSGHGNEFARRRADTNSENFQAVFRRGLRRRHRVAAKVFAVGDEDENFFLAGPGIENRLRLADRAANVRASARNGARVN